MFLQNLKTGDKFIFSSKQVVRTTTWAGGQVTEIQVLGRGVKGEVIKANPGSVRVVLQYRDKDREPEKWSLRFDRNREVEVEKIYKKPDCNPAIITFITLKQVQIYAIT